MCETLVNGIDCCAGCRKRGGRRACSLLGSPLQLPASSVVTSRLVPGSAAFGIGCRLTGFCLVPALVTLGAGYPKATGFVAAMMAGMAVRLRDHLAAIFGGLRASRKRNIA